MHYQLAYCAILADGSLESNLKTIKMDIMAQINQCNKSIDIVYRML